MNNSSTYDESNKLADQAASSAEQAIKSTQTFANSALDGLSGTVEDARQKAAPLLNNAGEQVTALAHRGVDAVRDTTQELRDKAQRASESTVSYIKEDPVKAMLIAAATGAALMAMVSLMSRPRDRA
jgi:ElaB/YqjD/DUF883 family membrane-anchored ribosome-binding protein